MSWSLQIANGDLSIGGQGLNTVQGGPKITQDLRCALLEPMGTDPITPSYGSIIDGGVDTEGNVYHGFIGQPNNSRTATAIQAEVMRIIRNYQAQQLARNQADIQIYGHSTLTVDEALLGVSNIDINSIADVLYLLLTLQTGAASDLSPVIPLS